MSDALKYEGRVLGWVHSWTGDGSNQFDIVVDGVG